MLHVNFRKLELTDIELIYNWFKKPEINKWYARGKSWDYEEIENKYLPRIIGSENIPSFIIEFDDIQIGFIQYYPLTAFLPDGFSIEQAGQYQIDLNKAAGMDLFIGEPLLLGKGYGPKALYKFLESIVFKKFDVVFVDPESINIRAIKAYTKCGFKPLDENHQSKVHLMILYKEALNNLSPFSATALRTKKF
jgi:aminoglycoside 6'-N-acetyltransferase